MLCPFEVRFEVRFEVQCCVPLRSFEVRFEVLILRKTSTAQIDRTGEFRFKIRPP